MGAQKGKDLLLKLDFNQDSVFETVAGMRSRRIAFILAAGLAWWRRR